MTPESDSGSRFTSPRMIPIVAVVREDVLAAVGELVAEHQTDPRLAVIMERNGWTTEAMVAGHLIRLALEES